MRAEEYGTQKRPAGGQGFPLGVLWGAADPESIGKNTTPARLEKADATHVMGNIAKSTDP